MVELRPFSAADAPGLLEWIQGPEALTLWSGTGFTWPLDLGQLRAYAGEAGPDRRLWAAHQPGNSRMVGHVALVVDPVHRTGRLARVLVAPDARGRGVGAAMVGAVLRVAFGELGLHRVSLGVFTHNAAALRLYERLGFVAEGVLREVANVEGRWWSSMEMGLLDREWRAQPGAAP